MFDERHVRSLEKVFSTKEKKPWKIEKRSSLGIVFFLTLFRSTCKDFHDTSTKAGKSTCTLSLESKHLCFRKER